MQCKPVTALPANQKWTFEIKFDDRCIAVKRGSDVTLFSRNEKVLNKRFQKVVDALASLGGDFVLDGELVAFDPQGKPSFQLLENNQLWALPVYFYAFDLLNRDGESLVSLAIERRRELLGRLLASPEDPLRLSPLLRAPSGQVLEAVCKLGLEGVVGKRIDSTYKPGERSGAWIKHRANREQEFVIGGYIPGAHSRKKKGIRGACLIPFANEPPFCKNEQAGHFCPLEDAPESLKESPAVKPLEPRRWVERCV
jgi:ATP-dependent DNA ligase